MEELTSELVVTVLKGVSMMRVTGSFILLMCENEGIHRTLLQIEGLDKWFERIKERSSKSVAFGLWDSDTFMVKGYVRQCSIDLEKFCKVMEMELFLLLNVIVDEVMRQSRRRVCPLQEYEIGAETVGNKKDIVKDLAFVIEARSRVNSIEGCGCFLGMSED
ncbi:hypothetical protein V6N13_042607 [Hibiscus sabdariffa]